MSLYKGDNLISGAMPNSANQSLSNLNSAGQDKFDAKVNKAGDTMTGALTIASTSTQPLIIRFDDIDFDIPPATTEYRSICIVDKNNNRMGVLEYSNNANGAHYIAIGDKKNSNENVYSAIRTGFTASGNVYCVFPNTECADGQWVYKFATIASNVSVNGSSALTYSLSSYLPNDGYKYEILLSATGQTDTTLNHSYVVYVQTDIVTGDVCLIRTRTVISGTALFSGGNAILPVGTGRTLKLTRNSGYYGQVALFALGYRRIGTNG